MRWCLPVGTFVSLHEDDNFGGRVLFLRGTGQLDEFADLADYDFGGKTSSLRFTGFENLGTDVVVVPEMRSTIAAALELLGFRCPTVLSIRGGAYPERLVINQPVRLEAREGAVSIAPP